MLVDMIEILAPKPAEARKTFGTCVRCNRPLTNPESAAAGMGPVCRGKAAQSDSGELLGDTPVLTDVPPITEVGLICRRLEDGRAAANVPHVIKYHSPDGFEWGYGGSGPAELALNALHVMLQYNGRGIRNAFRSGADVSQDAFVLHQDFKWAFLATMPKAGGHVPLEVINEWITRRLSGIAA